MGSDRERDRPAHTPGVISLKVPKRCVWAESGGRGGANQQKMGEGKMAARSLDRSSIHSFIHSSKMSGVWALGQQVPAAGTR